MSPWDFPTDRSLSLWHDRFPHRYHLWAGHLRLWRVDLPVRAASAGSSFFEWVTKARAVSPDLVRRLGVSETAVRSVEREVLERRSFAMVDLPAGPRLVHAPAAHFSPWPEPGPVPLVVLRPSGVDVVPLSDDWRTVPVIRTEAIPVAAIQIADGIDVFAAGPDWRIGQSPLWRLPNDAFPVAGSDEWSAACRAWSAGHEPGIASAGLDPKVTGGIIQCASSGSVATAERQWLWAGDGPLREAAIIEFTGGN